MTNRVVVNGRFGTLCPDLPPPLGVLAPGDIGVRFDGEQLVTGVYADLVEELGPENPIPSAARCGGGRGKGCCIFLTCGAEGFHCARHTAHHWALVLKDMSAKRNPVEPYPYCMVYPEVVFDV
jgi:hypothetical protein